VDHADAEKIGPFPIGEQRVQGSALVDNHGGLYRLDRGEPFLSPDRVKMVRNDLLKTQRLKIAHGPCSPGTADQKGQHDGQAQAGRSFQRAIHPDLQEFDLDEFLLGCEVAAMTLSRRIRPSGRVARFALPAFCYPL
jgi:hypothetical protein